MEPVLLARIGSNVARQRVAHPGTPVQLGQRRSQPVLRLHRDRALRLLHPDLARQVALLPPPDRLPARPAARRRPPPAHAFHRARPADPDPPRPARRGDRLHAARVPADLPPRRPDGADLQQRALRRSLAAALPRMLPGDQRAVLLPARALRQRPLRERRSLHRAERPADGQVPALGDRAGADRGRGVRAAPTPRSGRRRRSRRRRRSTSASSASSATSRAAR